MRHGYQMVLGAAALAGTLVAWTGSAAVAAPLTRSSPDAGAGLPVHKAQGIYFGFSIGHPRRHYGYYDHHRYYRPYTVRRYYYGPPSTYTYYTRPYVVRRAAPYYDADAVARCASRFKSFNVHTGTYITYGGKERLCPYLR